MPPPSKEELQGFHTWPENHLIDRIDLNHIEPHEHAKLILLPFFVPDVPTPTSANAMKAAGMPKPPKKPKLQKPKPWLSAIPAESNHPPWSLKAQK